MPIKLGDVCFCIVEPELRFRETLQALLSVEFGATILADDTLTALLAHRDLPVSPDLVILGDNPATLDGTGEIVTRIHNLFPKAALILLYAKRKPHDFPGEVTLPKGPLDAAQLIDTIHRLTDLPRVSRRA